MLAQIGMRRSLAAVGRGGPSAPPVESRDWLDALPDLAVDDDFFSLRNIAARCRHVFDRGWLVLNESARNNWYFCKTDHLEYFFAHHAPADPFVLFSGHSDKTVDGRHRRYLRRPELRAWFAANTTLRHPKLWPLPVGVANPLTGWPNDDRAALRRVRDAAPAKTRDFYVRFELHTNPDERARCLRDTGLALDPPREFPRYLEELASAYFALSPEGAGKDCHRTWEALHLRTIPVLRKSLLTDNHRDFPLVVLDDWADFRSIEFSPTLYRQVWGNWDPAALSLDGYLARVRRILSDIGAE
jgi:hypothetical protein